MKKELLAIFMVLREFRSMLLGAKINIYTDHKNLTFANFNTQRVLRWRYYVLRRVPYAPELFYLQGKLNVLAGVFSHLLMFDSLEIMEGKSLETQTEPIPLQDPTMYVVSWIFIQILRNQNYLNASSIYQRRMTITIQQSTC